LKAKTIKALDAVIAALEEWSEALKSEADKSGDSVDDEDTGSVSGRGKPAKAAPVPGKGKTARPAPDDDDDVDGEDDSDGDDDLPAAKPAVKGKAAAKPAAKSAAKGKAKASEDNIDTVKEKLTAVMNEGSLGKARVVKILKKFGATRSSELDEGDYAAVIKACDAALAAAAALADAGDEEEDV
jgi:hypothetical protein